MSTQVAQYSNIQWDPLGLHPGRLIQALAASDPRYKYSYLDWYWYYYYYFCWHILLPILALLLPHQYEQYCCYYDSYQYWDHVAPAIDITDTSAVTITMHDCHTNTRSYAIFCGRLGEEIVWHVRVIILDKNSIFCIRYRCTLNTSLYTYCLICLPHHAYRTNLDWSQQ